MADKKSGLSVVEARAYYDRFGSKQDQQGFYEDPVLDSLIAHGGFQEAQVVFEFGCGTGKFAARLLQESLPSTARYLGCDVSPVMVDLVARRLQSHARQATVVLSGGDVEFPLADHSVDRVVSNYVLDLLPPKEILSFFTEAHRVLTPGGRLCLASLTHGVDPFSRLVSSLWTTAFHMRPSLVGGCRPIRLSAFIERTKWQVQHRQVLTPFGVPSEALLLVAASTVGVTTTTEIRPLSL